MAARGDGCAWRRAAVAASGRGGERPWRRAAVAAAVRGTPSANSSYGTPWFRRENMGVAVRYERQDAASRATAGRLELPECASPPVASA